MISYSAGHFVRSLAGHDKDSIFLILAEEGDSVLLADGRGRTALHPKRKKKKHLQAIHAVYTAAAPWTDEDIRKAISTYHSRRQNVQIRYD